MGLTDDVAYVCILFASIGFGKLFRLIPPEVENGVKTFKTRRAVSTVVGLLICCLVSGWHTLHLLVQIAGNAAIVLLMDYRKCHLYSLGWCFSYLTFFRLSGWFGLPSPPPHTNAIILILTLKLVGLAFELHDTAVRAEYSSVSIDAKVDSHTAIEDAKPVFGDVKPSLSGILHYTLGHVGLITGPYYKYSVWEGMYQDQWNPGVSGDGAGWGVCEEAALKRAKNVPYYVVAFLVSGYLFPLSVVETLEWQQDSGLLWKLFYMMPIFFNFRMRIYAGFTLSECACIMAGLGAYPVSSEPKPGQGPSRPENLPVKSGDLGQSLGYSQAESVNFETVHNIDEWGSDFKPSMREALRCWNMTVQHWLVWVVYKRFPVKSLRTTMVMLVSSVWHGVHPGYYLSLGSVPLCLMVEDFYRRLVRSRLSESGKVAYDWVSWFVRMRWFDYLGMGFLLLRVDATLAYWSSVYFMGHLSLPVFYVLGLVVVKPLIDRMWKEREN
eukprot:GFUD01010348.1.p1 GENE.GFUD01010348.1~~GFUD01010348.1.p1  ORF type:complete len:495 (-),score=109.74 GFUD01010348.1:780-2264(-)